MNRKIIITTKPQFEPVQSDMAHQKYVWSYEVTIQNETDEIVQLLNRHWIIVDMTGHTEEVNGPGVIGLQPIIKPGKSFVYTSFCQLQMPQGTMEGFYEFQNLEEERFEIDIPKFVLSAPTYMTQQFRSRLH